MQAKPSHKEKFYWTLLIAYAVALFMLFWNQYRPRLVLAKCSDIALTSSQSYSRTQLPTDPKVKTYNELLTECIQDFSH